MLKNAIVNQKIHPNFKPEVYQLCNDGDLNAISWKLQSKSISISKLYMWVHPKQVKRTEGVRITGVPGAWVAWQRGGGQIIRYTYYHIMVKNIVQVGTNIFCCWLSTWWWVEIMFTCIFIAPVWECIYFWSFSKAVWWDPLWKCVCVCV